MTELQPHLANAFRAAMRRVASTVNVITVSEGAKPLGITATAMSSLALDPPSLLICINQSASMYASLEAASHFGVNVLHRDQEHIARMFADRRQHELRFLSGWEVEDGVPPRLADAQAAITCRRTEHHQFGTHSIFIGVVEDVVLRDEIDPLVYLDGQFRAAG